MELGAFSVSLSVSDLAASRDFYSKLGFEEFGGNLEHNYLMMRNGDHIIGLFQGMFDGNILTFNPGWDQAGSETDSFTDVREIEAGLREAGINIANPVDSESGPGSLMITDPDGNTILIDQHR